MVGRGSPPRRISPVERAPLLAQPRALACFARSVRSCCPQLFVMTRDCKPSQPQGGRGSSRRHSRNSLSLNTRSHLRFVSQKGRCIGSPPLLVAARRSLPRHPMPGLTALPRLQHIAIFPQLGIPASRNLPQCLPRLTGPFGADRRVPRSPVAKPDHWERRHAPPWRPIRASRGARPTAKPIPYFKELSQPCHNSHPVSSRIIAPRYPPLPLGCSGGPRPPAVPRPVAAYCLGHPCPPQLPERRRIARSL